MMHFWLFLLSLQYFFSGDMHVEGHRNRQTFIKGLPHTEHLPGKQLVTLRRQSVAEPWGMDTCVRHLWGC